MSEPVDYLVLGSGLSALSFSALMAKRGKSVKILEAHEFFGGYGHTFSAGEYQFNAQLHYVISCGAGDIVHTFLKKLGLAEQVTFNRLNAEGYDRVFCGDQKLFIPYGYDNLRRNMEAVCPAAGPQVLAFIDILVDFNKAAQAFPRHWSQAHEILAELPSYLRLFKFRSATLQQVFDNCRLPKILQTLVAGQLIDYMQGRLLPHKALWACGGFSRRFDPRKPRRAGAQSTRGWLHYLAVHRAGRAHAVRGSGHRDLQWPAAGTLRAQGYL